MNVPETVGIGKTLVAAKRKIPFRINLLIYNSIIRSAVVEVQQNFQQALGQTILLTKYTAICVYLVHGMCPVSIVKHLMPWCKRDPLIENSDSPITSNKNTADA
jgi:hypothetical protein